MTIANVPSVVDYTATGATTVFPVPFVFFEDTDLLVTVGGAVKTLGVDYSVSAQDVIFTAAPVGAVQILRAAPYEQVSDFTNQGSFLSESIERAIDRAVALIQQVKDGALVAAGVFQSGDASAATVIVPGGTTARALANRFDDVINVLEFGAVAGSDSVGAQASNWLALRAAIALATSRGGGKIYFPAGTYFFTPGDTGAQIEPLIPTGPIPTSGIHIFGDGKATSLNVYGPPWITTHFLDLKNGGVNVDVSRIMFSRWTSIIHTTGGGYWIDGSVKDCWINACESDSSGAICDVLMISGVISHNVLDVVYGNAIKLLPGSCFVQIRNNLFYGVENRTGAVDIAAIRLAGTGADVKSTAVTHIDISGNIFYESGQAYPANTVHAVSADGAAVVMFNGNVVEQQNGSGVYCGRSSPCRNVSAHDNVFLGDADSYSVKGHAVYVKGGTNASISGNIVSSPTLDGIWVESCSGTSIIGNTSSVSATGRGIAAFSCSSTRIIGNICNDNALSGITAGSCDGVVVVGNTTLNNDSGSVYGATDSGAGGIVLADCGTGLVQGNVSRNTSGVQYQQNNIQLAGANSAVIVSGNQLNGYRAKPLSLVLGADPLVSNDNYWNQGKGEQAITVPAGGYTTNSLTEKALYVVTATGNGTITLPTQLVWTGMTLKFVRRGTEAFTVNVGGLKTIPSATAAWVEVQYDGAAWRLTGYGTL